jgi:AcrR family transcriptional regulator
VHIRGAGAVGLSYGYLLTVRGHEVVHTSLRDSRPRQVPVRARIGGETTRGFYTPRFVDPGGHTASAIHLFAAPPSACQEYPGRRTGGGPGVRGAADLIFAGVFGTDWRARPGPWSMPHAALVFPLISCEYAPDDGLNLVTDLDVEVLSHPESDPVAGPVLEAMGLRVSAWVREGRFLARYVQTAAVYAVLAGLTLDLLRPEQVRSMLTGVFAELLDAARTLCPDTPFDFPDPPLARLEGLAPLIAAAVSGAPSDDLLVHNLRWLMGPAGRRKLTGHLGPFRRIWPDRPVADDGPARRLLDAVLATRRTGPARNGD